MRSVIGIDPGISGALAVVPLLGCDCSAIPMPVEEDGKSTAIDAKRAIAWLKGFKKQLGVSHVYIERVSAMPKQGVVSMFTFAKMYGEIRGIAKALGFKVIEVLPRAWKNVVLPDTEKDKQAAIDHVQRTYPDFSLLATPRSRTPHDGMADAICIAEYGSRQQ